MTEAVLRINPALAELSEEDLRRLAGHMVEEPVPMGTEIIQEQIWHVDSMEQERLQGRMDIPRESGWRIKLEGDVNLNVDVDFPPELTQDERVAQGMSTTAFHLLNAVDAVCRAPDPGIKTYLDLPLIAGRAACRSRWPRESS